MSFVHKIYFFLLSLVIIFNSNYCFSQTIIGHTGLITIPTAEILEDRDVVFSFGQLPASYAILRPPSFDDFFYFISIGYLPFLETDFGIVRSEDIGNKWGIGDRVAKFRFRILKESKKYPSLTFGLHDPFGIVGEEWAQHFCASYVVISKNQKIFQNYKVGFHVGYGTDWIKAADHQFLGIFGGISLQPYKFGSYMLEYDSKKVNFGFKISIKQGFLRIK